MGYRGVYEQYLNKKSYKEWLNLVSRGGGGVDPKSKNHIRNVLI